MNFKPLCLTSEDKDIGKALDQCQLPNVVTNIIFEYATSFLQVIKFILETLQDNFKDVVYLNGNIILELVSTTPQKSLIIYPPSSGIHWEKLGKILSSSIKYWDEPTFIFPLKSKGTIPFPEKLLHHNNDYGEMNIFHRLKLFPSIRNVEFIEEAVKALNRPEWFSFVD